MVFGWDIVVLIVLGAVLIAALTFALVHTIRRYNREVVLRKLHNRAVRKRMHRICMDLSRKAAKHGLTDISDTAKLLASYTKVYHSGQHTGLEDFVQSKLANKVVK